MSAFGSDELIDVRDQIVVREHDALGQSGGAAGVGKSGEGLIGGLAGRGEVARAWFQQVGEGLRSGLRGCAWCKRGAGWGVRRD